MELRGQARGKLLLFGEHAVVYGHPALGFALPLATHVTLSDTASAGDPESKTLIERLVQRWDPPHPEKWKLGSWAVRIQSTVPIGRGFGSSAALTGALARAWAQTLRPRADDDRLRQLAHQAEHEFHGHPSGVDTALALGQGLVAFMPRPDALPHIRNVAGSPFALVAGSLPRVADAKTLIAGIHGQRDQQPQQTGRHLAELGDLASQAIACMEASLPEGAATLGRLAQRAQEVLRQLGLSTPQMDAVLQHAQAAGACGGKLSGAGGGGAFVLFCPTRADAERVRCALAQEYPGACADLQSYLWNGRELEMGS